MENKPTNRKITDCSEFLQLGVKNEERKTLLCTTLYFSFLFFATFVNVNIKNSDFNSIETKQEAIDKKTSFKMFEILGLNKQI